MSEMLQMTIDGQVYEVPGGENLIDVVGGLGKEIPHYCYHSKLSIAGNCRMCLVEMGTDQKDPQTGQSLLEADGSVKVRWNRKAVAACGQVTRAGLHLRLNSALTRSCREAVMEFLLVNHPLDCPICDQAGECHLQEFATDYARGFSRYTENKNAKSKQVRLGKRIVLDNERCILCSLCVRFCDEVLKEPILGFTERGSDTVLSTFPDQSFDHNYSLNTVDLCPVGALTSTDFRFKMRPWFLKRVPSICEESSVGVNTHAWVREGKIYRITPRSNEVVNEDWMSDSGRVLYQKIESPRRLRQYTYKANQLDGLSAICVAQRLLKTSKLACVVGGFNSLEEQCLLRCLTQQFNARCLGHYAQGLADRFLISEDASPNLRGALLSGLLSDLPARHTDELEDYLKSHEVDTLLIMGCDVVASGLPESLLEGKDIIYCGLLENATSRLASLILPALSVFEKSGSFVNRQFRLQRFSQAVPPPVGLLPEVGLLARLIDGGADTPSLEKVWEILADSSLPLKALSYSSIPPDGLALEVGCLAQLDFVEQAGFKYTPFT